MRTSTLLLLPVLAVAGCAAESTAPPTSTTPRSAGAANQEPQPPNSLPRGSVTDDPLTSRFGNVGTTRVGPAAPSRY